LSDLRGALRAGAFCFFTRRNLLAGVLAGSLAMVVLAALA
jgi:hypothetical protein